MKIDFYISSLSSGGAEKVLTTMAKEFAARGNIVSVLSLEKRKQFYNTGNQVKLIKVNNTALGKLKEFLGDYSSVRKHIKESKADISISFLSRCNLLLIAASIFSKNKIVVCDRNNPLKEHTKFTFLVSQILYKRANAVVVQTNEIKSFYANFLQHKLFVKENPIDKEELDLQIGNENIEQDNTIISIGRLEPQKDFNTLIKAFAIIHAKYPLWKLKIYGEGDMRKEIESNISLLGMKECVSLCGRTEKPYYELKKSKVFVLSSFYEGFPNVLCEALCAGLVCISSECVSGPKELIKNGENGFLFKIENVDELANHLERAISNFEELKSLRHNAEDSVKHLYLKNNILEWRSMLEKISGGEVK